jgi:peroxiredoxin
MQQTKGPGPVDVDAVGPKVGEPLPDFSLPDQRGQPHRLRSLFGSKGAVIVFFRSADW